MYLPEVSVSSTMASCHHSELYFTSVAMEMLSVVVVLLSRQSWRMETYQELSTEQALVNVMEQIY